MSKRKEELEDPSLPPMESQDPPEKSNKKGSRKKQYQKELEDISIGAMKSAFQQTDTEDLAQQVLNSGGELSAEEYKNLYDHFMEKKV